MSKGTICFMGYAPERNPVNKGPIYTITYADGELQCMGLGTVIHTLIVIYTPKGAVGQVDADLIE
jgi:hypothetical protein